MLMTIPADRDEDALDRCWALNGCANKCSTSMFINWYISVTTIMHVLIV